MASSLCLSFNQLCRSPEKCKAYNLYSMNVHKCSQYVNIFSYLNFAAPPNFRPSCDPQAHRNSLWDSLPDRSPTTPTTEIGPDLERLYYTVVFFFSGNFWISALDTGWPPYMEFTLDTFYLFTFAGVLLAASQKDKRQGIVAAYRSRNRRSMWTRPRFAHRFTNASPAGLHLPVQLFPCGKHLLIRGSGCWPSGIVRPTKPIGFICVSKTNESVWVEGVFLTMFTSIERCEWIALLHHSRVTYVLNLTGGPQFLSSAPSDLKRLWDRSPG